MFIALELTDIRTKPSVKWQDASIVKTVLWQMEKLQRSNELAYSPAEMRTDLILDRLAVLVDDANPVKLWRRRLDDERDGLRRVTRLSVEDGQNVGLAVPDVYDGRRLDGRAARVHEQGRADRFRFGQRVLVKYEIISFWLSLHENSRNPYYEFEFKSFCSTLKLPE